MRKTYTAGLIALVVFVAVIVSIFAYNYFTLQVMLDKVINQDSRNQGISAKAHYGNYINTSELVYKLNDLPKDKSYGDAFRVFLQFSDLIDIKNIKTLNLVINDNSFSNVLSDQIDLQTAMEEVLQKNPGIQVLVYFSALHDPNILVYDLRNITGEVSSADVFRVLLQFAQKVKDFEFEEVLLSYKGEPKFLLKGNYFQKLGEELEFQNPVYTLRTFPENVDKLDGTRAFPEWTGGVLGVLNKQLEDLNEFNKKWYLDSWIEEQNIIENSEIK